MENTILAKLAVVVGSGRLDLSAYFRQCALLGVSFAAAVAAVSGTDAWASYRAIEPPGSSAQAGNGGYPASIPEDLVRLFAEPRIEMAQDCSTCPFSKFVKVPDPPKF